MITQVTESYLQKRSDGLNFFCFKILEDDFYFYGKYARARQTEIDRR